MSDQSPIVLVVDDDVLMQKLTVTALNHVGHAAVGCTDIRRATEIVNTTPSLRVLLSDICLQSGTGPELVRQVRAARPELKVVFMTGGGRHQRLPPAPPRLPQPLPHLLSSPNHTIEADPT